MADLQGLWGEKTQEELAAESKEGFKVLAPGWYSGFITRSEVKDTRSGGKMLVIDLESKGGDKLVDRFNILNNSEKAQLIGRQQLAKCACEAGVADLRDSTQLHGMPIDFKVEVEEFESNTTPGKMLKSNKIAAYKKIGTSTTGASASPEKPADNGTSAW